MSLIEILQKTPKYSPPLVEVAGKMQPWKSRALRHLGEIPTTPPSNENERNKLFSGLNPRFSRAIETLWQYIKASLTWKQAPDYHYQLYHSQLRRVVPLAENQEIQLAMERQFRQLVETGVLAPYAWREPSAFYRYPREEAPGLVSSIQKEGLCFLPGPVLVEEKRLPLKISSPQEVDRFLEELPDEVRKLIDHANTLLKIWEALAPYPCVLPIGKEIKKDGQVYLVTRKATILPVCIPSLRNPVQIKE